MNQQEWMGKLKMEGFSEIRVVHLEANFMPGGHTHKEATVHVILEGELIIIDEKGKRIFKKGRRVDFPAKTMHSAAFGPEGCTMIVGIKRSK